MYSITDHIFFTIIVSGINSATDLINWLIISKGRNNPARKSIGRLNTRDVSSAVFSDFDNAPINIPNEINANEAVNITIKKSKFNTKCRVQ